jgi:1,4-dihydroxy-2-naphthoyl-CoA hydrolase
MLPNEQEVLKRLNHMARNTLVETLGIVFTEVTEKSLTATMPVGPKVHQPYGLLNGGASAALAENIGSYLSGTLVHHDNKVAVGTSLTCNHLSGKTEGMVTGVGTIIRAGRNLHFCDIIISDEQGKIICHATMTNMIVPKVG